MYLVSRLDYSRLRELKYPIYGFLLGSIVVVYVIGTASRGSKRWIPTPLFNLQPSELGKVLLVLALSAFMVDRMRASRPRDDRAGDAARAGAGHARHGAAGPRDVARVRRRRPRAAVRGRRRRGGTSPRSARSAVVAIVLTLVALPAVGVNVLQPYQVDRLTSFLHPDDVLRRGGLPAAAVQDRHRLRREDRPRRGRTPTQTGLDFLPEHHTDFIFAVIGETYGFVGAALVLSLYALLIWRGLHILTQAKNLYGALIAGGITLMLLFQIFVNVGMTVGIMPITGVPAPLLSYGGSSLLVTFLALGLLQSISAQAREAASAKSEGLNFSMPEGAAPLRKQVLVTVDREETRVAILEATKEAAHRHRPPRAAPPRRA